MPERRAVQRRLHRALQKTADFSGGEPVRRLSTTFEIRAIRRFVATYHEERKEKHSGLLLPRGARAAIESTFAVRAIRRS
jgi:hypothetical protein